MIKTQFPLKKLLLLAAAILLFYSCSSLKELSALSKCEFRLHSLQNPEVCGIDISQKGSWSDFNFMEGQAVLGQLMKKKFPVELTVNVEVRNPGSSVAAVNSLHWIAFLDELQLARGYVQQRVEINPSGTKIIPVRISADLINYLEGGNPSSMLNFAMNLINTGQQTSQLSMKIKPGVRIGSKEIQYPDYFTLTKEYKSGN
jgi:LEA14-like dessication related protein